MPKIEIHNVSYTFNQLRIGNSETNALKKVIKKKPNLQRENKIIDNSIGRG